MDRDDFSYFVSFLALIMAELNEGLEATLWLVFAFVTLAISIAISIGRWRHRKNLKAIDKLRQQEAEKRQELGIRDVKFNITTDAKDEQVKKLIDGVQAVIDSWHQDIKAEVEKANRDAAQAEREAEAVPKAKPKKASK